MNYVPKTARRFFKLALFFGYLVFVVVLIIVLARHDLADTENLAHSANAGSVPHAVIIMMENKEQTMVVGSSSAPYITSLAKRYGFAARYYGVTHPSLPNYVASIAGDFFNAYNDWDGNRFSARNIIDQLERRKLTWKAYMESMPGPGYDGDTYPLGPMALYNRKHDPFMLMTDIIRSRSRRDHVVSATQLQTDLRTGHVPNLAYISPNLCHDMHGIDAIGSPCPGSDVSGLIRIGDRYLATLIPQIMRSRAWTGNSVIVITWDEGESTSGCCNSPKGDGGGLVPTIIIARQGARAFISKTQYNHYSLLKTLQTVWKLGCLANTCSPAVKPMTEFLHPAKKHRIS